MAISAGLALSQILERSAWRHLIQREAKTASEAEQKALYIIAATLARAKTLQPDDVPAIIASAGKFRGRLSGFVRKSDR
jgi:hypothetical protein